MKIELLVMLVIFLITAVVLDIRYYRIPNWLILTGIVTGIVVNAFFADAAIYGGLESLAGMGLGLLIFLPFYIIRVMGAGDVKLIALVGAFSGYHDIAYVALAVMLSGGVLALMIACYQNKLKKMLWNIADILIEKYFSKENRLSMAYNVKQSDALKSEPQLIKFPYSTAIAIGTLAYYSMTLRLSIN